jgi:DNA-directed RNA polymerase subunit H
MPKKPKKSIFKKSSKKTKKNKKDKEKSFYEIIKNHELMPEARILNEKEVEELLNKFKIKKENLPKIFSNDPLVKIVGAKVGDVLEIKRKSNIAGESIYYRLVIE